MSIAMQCFENFGGGKCPSPGCAPEGIPPLVTQESANNACSVHLTLLSPNLPR